MCYIHLFTGQKALIRSMRWSPMGSKGTEAQSKQYSHLGSTIRPPELGISDQQQQQKSNSCTLLKSIFLNEGLLTLLSTLRIVF